MQHECIQFELPSSGWSIAWLFNNGGRPCEILAQSAYVCSDDVLGGVTLAKHGTGLFQTYRFIIERELAEGSRVEVLQPYAGRSRPFTLLYSHGRHMPLRLRAFIDFLMERQRRWGVEGGLVATSAKRLTRIGRGWTVPASCSLPKAVGAENKSVPFLAAC